MRTLIYLMLAAAPVFAQHARTDPPPGSAVFFETLGSHHRTVRAASQRAEAFFDQGLRLFYAFNLEEAVRSFEEASRADPACAMAPWGKALALGPNINWPGDAERHEQAYQAIQAAVRLAQSGPQVERDMIEALATRYVQKFPADEAGRKALDEAYASAMKALAAKYPADMDILTLYAEAMMNLRPWDLWTVDGKPQPGTEEIVAALERVLAAEPGHPGANHFYIHAVEASPQPERAVAAAGRLATLMPGAAHMVHMPGHIYMRVGRYEDACEANRRAIRADQTYYAQLAKWSSPEPMVYPMYIAHNYHFLSAAAMMQGRAEESIRAAKEMTERIPEDFFRQMPGVDAVLAMPILMQARFGRWDEVLRAPEPSKDFPFVAAMRHYARGLALASTGKPADAKVELEAVAAAVKATPEDARQLQNSAKALLAIAEDVLAGRIAAAEGRTDDAVELLTKAAAAEDVIRYDEPPNWSMPVRTALGEVLLKAGRHAEAERAYLDDLKRNPENGWSLFGLAQSLKAQGKDAAGVEQRLKKAWANADTTLTTTWY